MTQESNSKDCSSVQVNLDSSESTIGINIKTLDSRTFSLRVQKNIPVPALKDMIVTAIGVPSEQQRLIYRGKVLKDEQLLSELHMEDGDTLHLVLRQPVQPQPTTSAGATEASRTSSSQANDSASGVQRNRVGQVAHSVLVGTINVPDRNGEAMIADISRNIETLLGSLGLVSSVEPTGGPGQPPSISQLNQGSSGARVEGSQNTSRTAPGDSAQEGFIPSNNIPQLVSTQFSQLPLIRTLNQQLVVPDALSTLSEFINRMELVLQTSSSSNNAQHQPHSEASSLDARGLPTPEFLCSVMERAQQLLRENAASALMHVSTRLQREGSSSDPVLRGQIQHEAMQLGISMQHLGAMLLELGRTIMTLRMGQSQAESSVNAGPAVYLSPTGPNPIMVQPNTLFGASPLPLISGASVGASPGNPLNNINIHLHAGSSVAPSVSSTVAATSSAEPHEQTSAGITGASDSSSTRGLPLRAVVSATPVRTAPEASGHVFSVTYPVHIRAQHPISIHYSSPQGAGSTSSSGGQSREHSSILPPSISVPAIVAQVTARIANALTGNPQLQSSSAQGSHSVAGSGGAQSDLTNSALQPPEISSSIAHTATQSDMPSSLHSDSQEQNSLPLLQTSQDSSNTEKNVFAGQEDQFSGNDDETHNSDMGFTKHDKQSSSGKNCSSDLSGSGKEKQQLDENQTNSVGSGISVEESFTPNSYDVLAHRQSACLQSNSSDVESLKREQETVESQKLPPSNNQVESNVPTPLGLLGGLQTKKRMKPLKPKGKDDAQIETSSSDQNQHSTGRVPAALPSLPSLPSVDRGNNNGSSNQLSSLISQFMSNMPSGSHDGNVRTDFSGMIANTMQSPAFNNLITSVASQSRVSNSDLRSMLEQCVQNPAIQNTINQFVQEGQSPINRNIQSTEQTGLDFAGVIQQMLPVVSQVLGRASTRSAPVQDMQSGLQPESIDVNIDVNNQVDLSQALKKIEQNSDSRSIFGTLLEGASHLYGEETAFQDIVELGNDQELANEFMELLKHDLKRRLEEDS